MDLNTYLEHWCSKYAKHTNTFTFNGAFNAIDEFYLRNLDKHYDEVIDFLYNSKQERKNLPFDMKQEFEEKLSPFDFFKFLEEYEKLEMDFYENKFNEIRLHSWSEEILIEEVGGEDNE